MDASGNVYVADDFHGAIKQIPYNGGNYGTPVALGLWFAEPVAVAVDGNGNLFTADEGNSTVKEIPCQRQLRNALDAGFNVQPLAWPWIATAMCWCPTTATTRSWRSRSVTAAMARRVSIDRDSMGSKVSR